MSFKIFNGLIAFCLLYSNMALTQDIERQILRGTVENEVTEIIMKSVHVLNLNTIVGSITDEKGVFEIEVKPNKIASKSSRNRSDPKRD